MYHLRIIWALTHCITGVVRVTKFLLLIKLHLSSWFYCFSIMSLKRSAVGCPLGLIKLAPKRQASFTTRRAIICYTLQSVIHAMIPAQYHFDCLHKHINFMNSTKDGTHNFWCHPLGLGFFYSLTKQLVHISLDIIYR